MSEVSSWFSEEVQAHHLEPKRRLILGINSENDVGSIYPGSWNASEYVLKWPTIKHDWEKLAPNNLTFKLTNANQELNHLHEDDTHLTKEACVQIGIGGTQLFTNPYFQKDATWTKRPSSPAVWSINVNSKNIALDYDPAVDTTDTCFLYQSIDKQVSETGLGDWLGPPVPSYYRIRAQVDSFVNGMIHLSFWSFDSEYHRTDAIIGTPGNLGSSFFLDEVYSVANGNLALAGFYVDSAGGQAQMIVNGMECARYGLVGSQSIIDPDFDSGSWSKFPSTGVWSFSPDGTVLDFDPTVNSVAWLFSRVHSYVNEVATKPIYFSVYVNITSWTQGQIIINAAGSGWSKNIWVDTPSGVNSRAIRLNHTIEVGSYIPDRLAVVVTSQAGGNYVNAFINNFYAHKYVDSAYTYLDVFRGDVTRLKFQRGRCDISLSDKWNLLGRKIIGTDEEPVEYVNSNYLAGDIAWWLCTSHGGLSSQQSSYNPDIDWVSFNSWSNIVSKDQLFINAKMSDIRVSEALGHVAKMTGTAIYVDDQNRIKFKQFGAGELPVQSFTGEHIIDMGISLDESNIHNKIFINADYEVSSETYNTVVTIQNSDSVNSFGLYEDTLDEQPLWLVGSTSAFVYGTREVFFNGTPPKELDMDSSLYGLPPEIGESINVGDTLMNLNETFRVTGKEVALNTGKVTLMGRAYNILNPFTLDVSALDSSDALL